MICLDFIAFASLPGPKFRFLPVQRAVPLSLLLSLYKVESGKKLDHCLKKDSVFPSTSFGSDAESRWLISQYFWTMFACKNPSFDVLLEACEVESSQQSVTRLLANWQAGDEEGLRALFPVVYNELRRVAHYHLQKERPDHTLQSMALVHEAYLRLVKQGGANIENREHFLAICALLMRQILVEYARRHRAAKRGGGETQTLLEGMALTRGRSVDLMALDAALDSLAKLDAQQGRVVELRFFGGLSIEETARVMEISAATVKRDWTAARAWLHREISRKEHV